MCFNRSYRPKGSLRSVHGPPHYVCRFKPHKGKLKRVTMGLGSKTSIPEVSFISAEDVVKKQPGSEPSTSVIMPIECSNHLSTLTPVCFLPNIRQVSLHHFTAKGNINNIPPFCHVIINVIIITEYRQFPLAIVLPACP